MNGTGLAGQQVPVCLGGYADRVAQPGRPVRRSRARGGGVGQPGEEGGQVPGRGGSQRTMCRDLLRRVGHVDHLGLRAAVLSAELAVAQPEVQRRAHHQDQVRFTERGGPGPGHL